MQSAGQQCSCRALPRSGAKPSLVFRRPVPTRAARRQQACTCSAEQRHAHGLSRREALLAFGGAAAVALTPLPSSAEEGGACTAAGHQSGCTRCLHTLRLRSCSVLLQKQRPCMAEPPHPQVMVAMEAMLRRLPSEASICSLFNTITWLRFNARPAGFPAAICRYTFEYPATWKLDTVNKVGPHRGTCTVSSTCHRFHACLCTPPCIAWAGL